jgi:hypothetical protein
VLLVSIKVTPTVEVEARALGDQKAVGAYTRSSEAELIKL